MAAASSTEESTPPENATPSRSAPARAAPTALNASCSKASAVSGPLASGLASALMSSSRSWGPVGTRSSIQPRAAGAPAVGLTRPAVRAGTQPVQHLAGVRLDERVRVGLVRRHVDAVRVQVAEVDRLHDLARDPRRQGHPDPVVLPLLHAPGALAAQVRGVREVAPGLVTEALPLPQEVVAAVVADLTDLRVHDRDLGDVRRVDDHLAPV